VRSQNADGSWGSPRGTTGYDVYAPVPGSHDAFRAATTALCVMALRNPAKVDPGAARAFERGLEWLIHRGDARRATPDALYNVWTHAFVLQALAEVYPERSATPQGARIREAARRQIERLVQFETMYGGWNYYDFGVGAQRPASHPTSFGTSTGLVALHQARQAGFDAPAAVIERGIRMVRRCRKPDASYVYDVWWEKRPLHPANRDKGSLGRAQACNFALSLFGDEIGENEFKAGLDRLIKEHHFIEMGRKRQWPHESWYATSGYYYYYGHYYAGRIVETLRPEDRAKYGPKLLEFILPHQEPDGSWWDYDMYDYEKPYGTAFALMTIERCGK
jgi:hypothetical protein